MASREATWGEPTRRWLAAAIIAAVAMFGWLTWHAIDAVVTLEQLRESHARAALVHDSMLRLEAQLQRTVQLALATGDREWLERHAEAEARLRGVINELGDAGTPQVEELQRAVAALDEVSAIEARATSLLDQGRGREGFGLVTGPEYEAAIVALGAALRTFDDRYHGWLLSQSRGLTRRELLSLVGALSLFAVAIVAWVLLVRRLQREKAALLLEMEGRNRAEAGLRRVQKVELLGQLAGSVAHDVDNTLSAIVGYSILARNAPDSTASQRALDGLDRAVRQGRGLTSNLLSFVRHERAARRPVELGALVSETRAWLAPLLPGNITVDVSLETEGDLWIDAEPVSLQQAIVNLALNSRDAMPDGGRLTLSLSALGGAPGEAGGAQAGRVCIGVADTGCGMDAGTLAKAREPLFSTKPEGRGTGLGLPSVERVVVAHGGSLELESVPGRGTVVRMLLPGVRRRSPPARAPVVVQVVSADSHARRLLVDALGDAGLEVAGFSQPDELARGSPGPAVIVVDWVGPPVEALAALHGLRVGGVSAPFILILDTMEARPDPLLEDALTGLAMVVTRSVPMGELGRLVYRLVSPRDAGWAA
jgi:signal transduction histidine kinase